MAVASYAWVQADLQSGLVATGQALDGQEDPRNLSMFSFLSCGAAPRVQSDDDPAVKIRPEPYAPLLNLGPSFGNLLDIHGLRVSCSCQSALLLVQETSASTRP